MPRPPLYTLDEFADRKGIDRSTLHAVFSKSDNRPPVQLLIVKNFFTHGMKKVRRLNGYSLNDLEAWYAKLNKVRCAA